MGFYLQNNKENPVVMLPLRSSLLLCTAYSVCIISLLFLYSLHMSNNGEQRLQDILQQNNPNNHVRQEVTSNKSPFITKTCESEDLLMINFL